MSRVQVSTSQGHDCEIGGQKKGKKIISVAEGRTFSRDRKKTEKGARA